MATSVRYKSESTSLPVAKSFRVLDVRVDAVQIPDVIGRVEEWIARRDACRYIAVTGMHGVMEARQNVYFREVPNKADLVVPDGMPLVWCARLRGYLRTLWELVQSMPEYRGNTTLIFTPDHGRGKTPHQWRDHGQKIPDSKYIWLAFLGPDTPALGERSKVAPVTQNQIAATLAALLGEDYAAAVPKAGKPITEVLPH
ncbi:MAG: hypothetical protein ABSG77_09265 [Candidatus Acidiferrum sp.]|jgi:hypothetical protein